MATSSVVPTRPAADWAIIGSGSPAPQGPDILKSSFASGVRMMPGLIVLIRAPRSPHNTASALNPQRVAGPWIPQYGWVGEFGGPCRYLGHEDLPRGDRGRRSNGYERPLPWASRLARLKGITPCPLGPQTN